VDGEVRILLVEDDQGDAQLFDRELGKAGIKFTTLRAQTEAEFVRALNEFGPALIVSDFSLPNFDA
jgi:DNA-binding response OmpR family regulator